MSSEFKDFDLLGHPVAVVGSCSEIAYSNKEFKRLYQAGNFKNACRKDDSRSLHFCTDKGEIRCYTASVAEHGEYSVWSFSDVTALISRKVMVEAASIDESKLTGDDLRKVIEKNKRLTEVVEAMESGVMVEGESGSLVYINNSFLKIVTASGLFSPEGNIDNAGFYHDILENMDLSGMYRKKTDYILQEKRDRVHSDEFRCKDGRIFTRIHTPLYIDGKTKGHLWRFRDISVRKQMENFKNELEAMLTALESSGMVGLYLDYEGFRFVNGGLLQILGVRREEIVRNGLTYYLGDKVYDTTEGGEHIMTYYSPAGDRSTLQVISDTMRIAGKTAEIASVIDITDKVRLQNSLKRNEAKFRRFFADNTAVMLVFEPATMSIIDANKAAAEYYGCPIDALKSRKMSDITVHNSYGDCLTLVGSILETRRGAKIPVRQYTAGSVVRDVELLITPVETDGSVYMFIIVEDVSQRLKYQQELEDVNKNLQFIVEEEIAKRRRNEELLMEKMRLAEIGEMIGSIAHQWRQPLNTLGLLVQDVQDASEFGELTKEYVRDTVGGAMRQIDYMSRTIDDFRDFFKPSKSKEIFDIKGTVEQVLSIVRAQLVSNSIRCVVACECPDTMNFKSEENSLSYCGHHDMRVRGYPNEFKQVLLNLISNSKDALMQRRDREICISIKHIGKKIRLDVEDTGGGIPENILHRVFDPYFTTKSDKGGTGIGLYMSKAIIETNMRGSLTVENTDSGCRFSILMDRIDN
ncbi:PAS domain-containing sensor histidine kinase [Seleniivibrio woodruffii]|uniref:PAS domain-containing sensor histidine kinase n=1 Tax=Seleniivibrio woodruffii TaxID=1078050 RepID=UPI0024090C3F|nr:ATP-binding protein [Seleniivibrio woodruffii]